MSKYIKDDNNGGSVVLPVIQFIYTLVM